METIVTDQPDAHLIVAQITPYADTQVDKNKLLYDYNDYNAYMHDTLVPQFSKRGHKFSTVDMYSLFLKDINDYDLPVAHGEALVRGH